ncbi:glycosyltransferase [Planctomycetota bacterium]
MLKNVDIICFGPTDYWGMNPSCATHIMRKLSAANRVVYINPISSDLFTATCKRGFFTRVFRKAKSMFMVFRKPAPNLYVLSPFFLPIQGIGPVDKLNNILLTLQLRLVTKFLKMKSPILWAENVRCAEVIRKFSWPLVIYHVSDRFEECPYTQNREMLSKREEHVAKNSNLLICVSKELYQSKLKYRDRNSNVYYLPHGVEFSLFNQAAQKQRSFPGLRTVAGAIAGYFGTLTEQNDIELLEYCVENLPDVTFVFAGEITAGDYSKLKAMQNTIFLGRVAYEQIPLLCASFDVCLLPWKMNNWIYSCNPLKLFEYMAAGKPIVSVPIKEIVNNYSDIVSVTCNKKKFSQAIKWELANDTKERKEKRIAIAQTNSWENHAKKLGAMTDTALLKKHWYMSENFKKSKCSSLV